MTTRRFAFLLALLPIVLVCSLTHAAAPAEFSTRPGFKVDVLYQVPPDQGSWVCLTVDPQGRIIASDQFGQLYRLVLPTPTRPVQVHPLRINLGSAQGLLCAFDSLYLVVNRGPDQGGSALYRAQDTNQDDHYDQVHLLRELDGHGEHGPHAILTGPDQRSLYLLAGNATRLPQPERSLVPRVWARDELLPHLMQTDGVWRPDRPGGWVCRLDPSGNNWELVAIGLRNPYDLAFNADGELFTFDADMEWDLGTPWYRPTRVNHITSGAEFGWRTGSAKWPDHYADSLGSVVDVGESSPTGLAFGYGTRFPARYQRALFMGDWSYGKIYALHLEPHGASYRGSYEQFLSGTPLPVTDLVVHPQDGSLLFAVGGRRIPSTLYRVRYHGPEPTSPVDARDPDPHDARKRRHHLEAFHGRTDPHAIDTAWKQLADSDRAIRYAARVTLEHQPPDDWSDRALTETDPRTALAALIALTRCGDTSLRPAILAALQRFELSRLAPSDQSDFLRVCTLLLCRFGQPTESERQSLLQRLDPLFPAASFEMNRELAPLLVFLQAPRIVERTLDAMDRAQTQEEALHYALGLRSSPLRTWSSDTLERYLRWHIKALAAGGGVTFAEYLFAIRTQILEIQPTDRLDRLTDLIHAPLPPSPLDQLKLREFVREWKVDDLLPALDQGLRHRNFEQGQTVFAQAMCLKCHRFRGQGGLTGPELTGAAARFDSRSLLESILDPNQVISDQYATIEVTTRDGEQITGRIGDHTETEILLKYDLFNPANFHRIRHDDILRIEPSATSLMPPGLLDTFTRDEILDLIAYLQAQGDPHANVFR